jgi:hypothetical protein
MELGNEREHEPGPHKSGKPIVMYEFVPSPPVAESGAASPPEFIACLNGYPQASATTFESAVALAQEFWLFTSEQTLSIYEVQTGIHYDLDLAAMMASKQLLDHMRVS